MKKQTGLKFQFVTMVIAILMVIHSPFVMAQPAAPSGQQWQLVVNDDFNSFNTSTWGYGSTPWGSENQSSCTIIPAEDTYVSGGSLVLRSRKGPFTGATGTSFAYSSGWAWLKTWRTYGYVEIRAQYPNARGTWPAFWMLMDGWPPEIDIAEYRGTPKNYMTMAYYDGSWNTTTRTGDYTGWHTYGLDWEPGSLKFYIDGTLYKTVTGSTVPSTSMYVILSNGSDCSDSDGSGFPNYYNIDYFRWYQLQTNSTTITSGGTYSITNRNSGKVLSPLSASTSSGANIVQVTSSGTTAQQWVFTDLGTGYWNIKNVASGLLMDINGASTADGANNIQWSANNGNNQQWQIVATGSYYNIINRNSGKYLDITGASTAENAQDIQWPSNGGNNQQWTLTRLKSAVAPEAVNVNEQDISIYPSPLVGNELTIEGLSGASTISFIDLNGKVVKEQQVNETGSAQINVSLKPGVYFVKIATSLKTTIKKLVVE